LPAGIGDLIPQPVRPGEIASQAGLGALLGPALQFPRRRPTHGLRDYGLAFLPVPDVALFVTCLVDQIVPETGIAAVRLLETAGCRVIFPEGQSCCGQPALSTGEPEAATVLAHHFVRVFEPY